jgi:hypothetical protein
MLLVTANVVPSSPMEELISSERSVITIATRCNMPEEDILHSHCSENLKSHITASNIIIHLSAVLVYVLYLIVVVYEHLEIVCTVTDHFVPLSSLNT